VNYRITDDTLNRVYTTSGFTGGFPAGVVKVFRKRMQTIIAAPDERTFYQMKSLHFEKLKGDRSDEHSMRINDQWRLIVELEGEAPDKTVVVKQIEDYH
jgi:toxin HigB-1